MPSLHLLTASLYSSQVTHPLFQGFWFSFFSLSLPNRSLLSHTGFLPALPDFLLWGLESSCALRNTFLKAPNVKYVKDDRVVEKSALIDTDQHFLNIYGDQPVDRGTVVHFSSSDSGSPLPVQIFYRHNMQSLVQHWWECIANSGDSVEKWCFLAENLLYQTVVMCSL